MPAADASGPYPADHTRCDFRSSSFGGHGALARECGLVMPISAAGPAAALGMDVRNRKETE